MHITLNITTAPRPHIISPYMSTTSPLLQQQQQLATDPKKKEKEHSSHPHDPGHETFSTVLPPISKTHLGEGCVYFQILTLGKGKGKKKVPTTPMYASFHEFE
jgi:hypothetical protein